MITKLPTSWANHSSIGKMMLAILNSSLTVTKLPPFLANSSSIVKIIKGFLRLSPAAPVFQAMDFDTDCS